MAKRFKLFLLCYLLAVHLAPNGVLVESSSSYIDDYFLPTAKIALNKIQHSLTPTAAPASASTTGGISSTPTRGEIIRTTATDPSVILAPTQSSVQSVSSAAQSTPTLVTTATTDVSASVQGQQEQRQKIGQLYNNDLGAIGNNRRQQQSAGDEPAGQDEPSKIEFVNLDVARPVSVELSQGESVRVSSGREISVASESTVDPKQIEDRLNEQLDEVDRVNEPPVTVISSTESVPVDPSTALIESLASSTALTTNSEDSLDATVAIQETSTTGVDDKSSNDSTEPTPAAASTSTEASSTTTTSTTSFTTTSTASTSTTTASESLSVVSASTGQDQEMPAIDEQQLSNQIDSGKLAELETIKETELEAIAAVDESIGFGDTLFSAAIADACYDEYGNARYCEPEFENIAFERQVETSGECGTPASRFCTTYLNERGDQIRNCHICDAQHPKKRHPAAYLTDINNSNEPTCWVSAPISAQQQSAGSGGRSASGNGNATELVRDNVTLTLSFDKRYEITYLSMQFCSLKPDSLAILKSADFGKTWTSYQLYSSQCSRFYGKPTAVPSWNSQFNPLSGQLEAVCVNSSSSSAAPSTIAGRIAFSTLDSVRSSTENSSAVSSTPVTGHQDKSQALQDWMTATNIRIVLDQHQASWIQSSLVHSHHHLARQQQQQRALSDPAGSRAASASALASSANQQFVSIVSELENSLTSVSDTYNYAISDLTIGGRCKCNGHASRCIHNTDGKLQCDCQHNTDGPDCERCLPLHHDRPWQRATQDSANPCQPCNCNGHSRKCRFDTELYQLSGRKSGGVCIDCKDNTTGRHCHYCKEGYTRDHSRPMSDKDACKPCDCHPVGSVGKVCNQTTGQCPCKEGVTGPECNRCAPGYQQSSSPSEPCIKLPENDINYEPIIETSEEPSLVLYQANNGIDQAAYSSVSSSDDPSVMLLVAPSPPVAQDQGKSPTRTSNSLNGPAGELGPNSQPSNAVTPVTASYPLSDNDVNSAIGRDATPMTSASRPRQQKQQNGRYNGQWSQQNQFERKNMYQQKGSLQNQQQQQQAKKGYRKQQQQEAPTPMDEYDQYLNGQMYDMDEYQAANGRQLYSQQDDYRQPMGSVSTEGLVGYDGNAYGQQAAIDSSMVRGQDRYFAMQGRTRASLDYEPQAVDDYGGIGHDDSGPNHNSGAKQYDESNELVNKISAANGHTGRGQSRLHAPGPMPVPYLQPNNVARGWQRGSMSNVDHQQRQQARRYRVQQQQAAAQAPSASNNANSIACADCQSGTKKLNFRQFCHLDYAIKATILSKQVANDWTKYEVEIQDIFKSATSNPLVLRRTQRHYPDGARATSRRIVLDNMSPVSGMGSGSPASGPQAASMNTTHQELNTDGGISARIGPVRGQVNAVAPPSVAIQEQALPLHRSLKVGSVQSIWIPTEDVTCKCPRLKLRSTYLLMGLVDTIENSATSIQLDRHGVALEWKSSSQSKLIKYQRRHSKGLC